MEEKEVILTQEGYDKIEQELEHLRTVTRMEIAERIKVALGFGDLSENSEYDEAKNAQAENEAKIAELENKIRSTFNKIEVIKVRINASSTDFNELDKYFDYLIDVIARNNVRYNTYFFLHTSIYVQNFNV